MKSLLRTFFGFFGCFYMILISKGRQNNNLNIWTDDSFGLIFLKK